MALQIRERLDRRPRLGDEQAVEAAVAFALRWRGRPTDAEPGPEGLDLDPDDARRLDADLASFDR